MRRLLWLLLVCWAWGEATPPPPTVLDAYVVQDGKLVREARLTSEIQVVVCRSEFEAALKSQVLQNQGAYLYLEGHQMKGIDPAHAQALDGKVEDADTGIQNDRNQCADNSRADIAPAEKDASDKVAAAKSAADKASTEKDPTKKADLDKESKNAAALAAAAQANLDAVKKTAQALYSLKFTLNPELPQVDSKDQWLPLLERPWDKRPVKVSIGPDSGSPWPSKVSLPFVRLNLWWLLAWVVLFVFAVALFIRYAMTSDIIRDPGTLPAPAGGGAVPRKAYSLSRTQMALWTFLIAGAIVFIFLVTWNQNTVNPGVLALMGVSFGTTILAATADGNAPPIPSKGFISDILSDGDGPSFHRYQMVLFTIILAVIFVVKTATNLVTPQFDASLLGLMGISSGTYLGFKLLGK